MTQLQIDGRPEPVWRCAPGVSFPPVAKDSRPAPAHYLEILLTHRVLLCWLPEFVASWVDITGEDHYELEVQKQVTGVWTPHDVYDVSGTTITLDDSDGIEAGVTYRARVRAMPGA